MIDREDWRALVNLWLLWAAAILVAVLLFSAKAARSADLDGRYANSPNRDWYLKAELTPEAQKRFGFKSCCAHSDVVRTQFRPASSGADGWEYLDDHTWRRVPDDIIHADQAPSGEPIMFAINGRPTCFFPPEGGI